MSVVKSSPMKRRAVKVLINLYRRSASRCPTYPATQLSDSRRLCFSISSCSLVSSPLGNFVHIAARSVGERIYLFFASLRMPRFNFADLES
jgi:hypothetical protein